MGFTQKANTNPDIQEANGLSQAFLDPSTERSLARYGNTIQKYALKYELDWRLVVAVIRQESSFRPRAVSHKGAYGLMQIMPGTQVELTEKLGVPEARSPYYNIKAGMFHLRSLYRQFGNARGDDRLRLSLAAYNAGLSRVLDAQDVATYLGKDPNTWEAISDILPMLSDRYQSLHVRVWEETARPPRGGFFRGWRQTVQYVENIMQYYDDYQLAFR